LSQSSFAIMSKFKPKVDLCPKRVGQENIKYERQKTVKERHAHESFIFIVFKGRMIVAFH